MFQATELGSRGFLSSEEKDLVGFVHTLENTYSQQSFLEAKRNIRNNDEDDRFLEVTLLIRRKIRSLPAWLVFCLFVLSCSPVQAIFVVVIVLKFLKQINLYFLFLSWRDLGLLRSSFNLGSTQILDTYIQTGSLLEVAMTEQVRIVNNLFHRLKLNKEIFLT